MTQIKYNTIKFSHNWNKKLNNDIFTTIRKHTPDKESYYNRILGERFNIMKDKEFMGTGELFLIECKKYKDIPWELLILDTGLVSQADILYLFKKFGLKSVNDKMIILWFRT